MQGNCRVLSRIGLALTAAAMAVVGCAVRPPVLPPTLTPQATEAGLHLGLAWGRRIQALQSDVTGATISVTVSGKAPVVQAFAPTAWASDSLDVSHLPAGDAEVRLDAYHGATLLGSGVALVPLELGRRTTALISVGLDSRGNSSTSTLLTPTEDLPPGAVSGKILCSTSPGGKVDRPLEFAIVPIVNGTRQPAVTTNLTDPAGNYLVGGLSDGQYQMVVSGLRRSQPTVQLTGSAFSELSAPFTVSSASAAPIVNFDVGWDQATFKPTAENSDYGTIRSTQTFGWVAPACLPNATYQIAFYRDANLNTGDISNQLYLANVTPGQTSVSVDLRLFPPGNCYYVIQYSDPAGYPGGLNAYGRSWPIPMSIASGKYANARVFFSKLAFSTGGTGYHAVVLTNKCGRSLDLTGYTLGYCPTTTGQLSFAHIVGVGGATPILADNSDLLVWLRSDNATVSATAAQVDWTPGGVVQAGTGGELALYKSSNYYSSDDLIDYVKWGQPSKIFFEQFAAAAKLWTQGTTAVGSVTPPSTLSVIVPQATGSTNWQ